MMADYVGEHGASQQEIDEITPKLQAIKQQFLGNKPSFTKLPYDNETLHNIQSLAKKISSDFENLIVLGIGGSDLGARAVVSALLSPFNNFSDNRPGMRVFFLGGNTDPQEINDVLSFIDLKKTAINIISKSGDTIEPMSAFVFLRDKLIQVVGEENHAKHIIATTDASKGTMREITNQNGYASLIVPDDVGGRFSVLSTVGLFPAACAGIDIASLLVGGQDMDKALSSEGEPLNSAQIYAALQYLGYTKRSQHISVVMPYAEHLRQFGFWYRQLWAESLGKENKGPTPIASLGATDQHSQMQLYNEGPFDKLISFIRVESLPENFEIPHPLEDYEGVQYMAGHDFAKIINTEAQASALALSQNGRPNGTLILSELSVNTLGALFLFFEWATAYMGELLEINTYNQPGVEAGKTAMYALLGRKGYEERKKELEQHLSGKKYIV